MIYIFCFLWFLFSISNLFWDDRPRTNLEPTVETPFPSFPNLLSLCVTSIILSYQRCFSSQLQSCWSWSHVDVSTVISCLRVKKLFSKCKYSTTILYLLSTSAFQSTIRYTKQCHFHGFTILYIYYWTAVIGNQTYTRTTMITTNGCHRWRRSI